ncbi:carbohydrate ABC transporter permease [Sphingomonas sp. PAMC 26617]|uniref:carbohydrate ABC transporter permease n=2 Tax=unclassified Sphingomonas TaxID=196159 RepID=UPI0002890A2D|nr:carbohydrate ABC transporter permease [Sphingomonas sp. PAMC 26617]
MVVNAGSLLRTALVALLALVAVLPLLWMVNVSLMAPGTAATFPPPFWPARPTLANYRELLLPHPGGLTSYHILPALGNSVVLASLTTVLSLLLCVPAGYAFAKLHFWGRARMLQALLALAVVPAQVAMLPLFLMLKSAGLVNTYAGVLAPWLAGVYGVLFIRQATLAIPDEMLDAARIDGASEARIFLSVVLPLLRPVVVTLALFAFLASWSDFLWPLIAITDQQHYTLPVALAAISREHGGDTELMMAGAVVTTLPVLLLFLALQRYYFTGILGGSIKG